MLSSAILALRQAGIHTTAAKANGVLDVAAQGVKARFASFRRRRAPYPAEIIKLNDVQARLAAIGRPLLSVPYVSESLGARLTAAGWSWLDDAGNWELHGPGLLLQRRCKNSPPPLVGRQLPRGAGSMAIMRWLIDRGSEATTDASDVAAAAAVTRPRVIQVLDTLTRLGLAHKRARGRWDIDRSALLDKFIEEYRGPGGTTLFYYTLGSPGDAAVALYRQRQRGKQLTRWVVSGDVAADLLAPYRHPSHLHLFWLEGTPQVPQAWVTAHGMDDANVVIRCPEDKTVRGFGVTRRLGKADLWLADPPQILWDLHFFGGDDRVEAAEKLRAWILQSQPTA